MGTVLSFSPKNNHYDDQLPSVKEEKSIKKHGIFFNGLSWKKLSSINHHTNNQYPTQQAFKGTFGAIACDGEQRFYSKGCFF